MVRACMHAAPGTSTASAASTPLREYQQRTRLGTWTASDRRWIRSPRRWCSWGPAMLERKTTRKKSQTWDRVHRPPRPGMLARNFPSQTGAHAGGSPIMQLASLQLRPRRACGVRGSLLVAVRPHRWPRRRWKSPTSEQHGRQQHRPYPHDHHPRRSGHEGDTVPLRLLFEPGIVGLSRALALLYRRGLHVVESIRRPAAAWRERVSGSRETAWKPWPRMGTSWDMEVVTPRGCHIVPTGFGEMVGIGREGAVMVECPCPYPGLDLVLS